VTWGEDAQATVTYNWIVSNKIRSVFQDNNRGWGENNLLRQSYTKFPNLHHYFGDDGRCTNLEENMTTLTKKWNASSLRCQKETALAMKMSAPCGKRHGPRVTGQEKIKEASLLELVQNSW
jgi:hypothetical protein